MRDIKDYEGLYAVTSCGKIYSYKSKKFLKPFDNGKGYLQVILCKDGKQKHYRVHRLVAQTYLPNPDNLPQVNHIDEDKSNNALPNLEWCDAAYNNNYSFAKKVICIETQEIFESVTEAAKAVDVAKGNISKCCSGKRKTCAGYHWRYYDQKEEI